MSFDLGDVVPLTVDIRDSTGTLANATAVALTITLPDQTTTGPSVTNPTTGRYQANYTPAQAGRHVARWVATGTNASAYVDQFDVRPADPGYIVSLADAKAHLNKSSTVVTDDEELRRIVEGATKAVEWKVGPVVVQTVTDRIARGGCAVWLPRPPIVALVSTAATTSGGGVDAVADLDFDADSGRVWRLDGGPVQPGQRFTYRAGRPVVPANITTAGLVIIDHLWSTQRGGPNSPARILGADEVTVIPGLGFAVPNMALEMLAPDAIAPFLA